MAGACRALGAGRVWPGQAHPGWWTVGLGAGAAFVGGALGWVFFGRFFSTPNALWVSALAVRSAPGSSPACVISVLRNSPCERLSVGVIGFASKVHHVRYCDY